MQIGTLSKLKAQRAAEICRAFEPEEPARALLGQDPSPAQFVAGLEAAGQTVEALKFLAHGLPKREAAWWACLCVRTTLGDSPKPADVQALASAEKWIYEPTDAHRRLALQAAEATRYDTPAGWAAASVAWTGGSLTPPNQPVVAPAEDLSAKAVVGAVLLAAVAQGPEDTQARYQEFLESAVNIANGGNGRPAVATRG